MRNSPRNDASEAQAGGAVVTPVGNGFAPLPPLTIGLVNIMPAAAMGKTERQFQNLLSAAQPERALKLRLFTMQGTEAGALPAGNRYEPLEALWESEIDGLIVTGTEPKAAFMTDEPCWPELARLVDWAGNHTVSAIWSCFAAHAAVYRLDGITRQQLPAKLSGVFTCGRATQHALLEDLPATWPVPHSRRNHLDEHALRAAGYEVLTSGGHVGVDSFIKQRGNSRFVFFQGHPEYGGGNLLGEYYRDIRRFLAGDRADYPAMPEGCLDEQTATGFAVLQARLSANPAAEIFEQFCRSAVRATPHVWRDATLQLYTNWLADITARRQVSYLVNA